VGSQVESTGSDVREVHSDLSKLGTNMEDLKLQQGYTAEGIYVLCRCHLTKKKGDPEVKGSS